MEGEEVESDEEAMGPSAKSNPEDGEGANVASEIAPTEYMEEDMADDDLLVMDRHRPTPHELLEESASTPLFPCSGFTQLRGTLLLLNCLRTHSASNQLVNKIFGILNKSLLPKVNFLPPTNTTRLRC